MGKKRRYDNRGIGRWIVLLKYGFSLAITLLAVFATSNWQILAVGLMELSLILVLTIGLMRRAPILGHVAHFLLLFIYNAQMLVMYFGNSYITLLMLTNLVSLGDLSGHFGSYMLLIAPMVVILLLPTPPLAMGRRWGTTALGVAGLWLCTLVLFGPHTSPLVSACGLLKDHIDHQRMRASLDSEDESDAMRYYHAGVGDYRTKPKALPEMPNIILILVEGLSQNVVEDARGVMPNLAALEQKSIFFKNYYNHTFATYRGLIGQLYSGFQLSDRDANQLISLQSILHDFGYQTAFINTEPDNVLFTDYLKAMDFDDFISNTEWLSEVYPGFSYVTDKDAYERLLETALAQHVAGQPFFTAMYSFGTHATLDSPDEVFGDGDNSELNKFYNLDVQLGSFMERFEASALAEDTLVVITADHATYMDKDFTDTFPDYERWHTEVDRIPLLLYYRGIKPETVNARRRNSIDLAPTVLDYIDLSAPNMFLGESLFKTEPMKGEVLPYDRCFFDGSFISKTGVAEGKDISDKKKAAMLELLMDYFAVSIPSDQGFKLYDMDIQLSEDGRYMRASSDYPLEQGQSLWFVVWGSAEGENDQKFYRGQMGEDGHWHCDIPLEEHGETGIYYIHAYIGDENELNGDLLVITKCFYVRKIPEP